MVLEGILSRKWLPIGEKYSTCAPPFPKPFIINVLHIPYPYQSPLLQNINKNGKPIFLHFLTFCILLNLYFYSKFEIAIPCNLMNMKTTFRPRFLFGRLIEHQTISTQIANRAGAFWNLPSVGCWLTILSPFFFWKINFLNSNFTDEIILSHWSTCKRPAFPLTKMGWPGFPFNTQESFFVLFF